MALKATAASYTSKTTDSSANAGAIPDSSKNSDSTSGAKPLDSTKDYVQMVVDGWNSSWNYTSSSYHTIWQNMTALYNCERIDVGYQGISDTVVPMAFETIERTVAATSGDKPDVQYIPTRPDQQTNTDVLNNLFAFYWDLDSWTLKSIQHSRSLFKLGTAVGYVYWDIDHPVWKSIPLRDFFIDPTTTILDYQNARYMGYRFLASKATLAAEMIVDPVKKKLVPKYKNLDKLSDSFEGGDQTAKEMKDTHMGSTLSEEALEDQIEVICYWTKDEVWYVGNRQEVIYYNENFFKQREEFLGWDNPTGMYPFFIDANLADETQLYGRSMLQSIAKPIELLNDITNQNVDAVSWALDPVMELDPMYSSYIDKIKNVTGAVYPFKPGSYVAVNKPPVPTNAFNERSIIKAEIHEATGINELFTSGSRITAAAINYEQMLATQRFDLLTTQLENGGYYQLAKLVFQLVRHYVTKPVMYRIIGPDGADWQKFDPKQFEGDYEPRVRLQTYLEKKKQAKMRDLKELYTAFLGNPFVDQQALTTLIVQNGFDLDPDEASDLIKSQQQVQQDAQSGAPGTPGAPGAQDKGKPVKTPQEIALEGIAKTYGTTDAPDIKAQLEQLAGLQPSAIHEGAMESMASQQTLDQAQHGATLGDLATAAHPALPSPALPQPNQPQAPATGPGVPAVPSAIPNTVPQLINNRTVPSQLGQ